MALDTIVNMVRLRLPWLLEADNPTILSVLQEQYVVLQPWTNLDDDASEVEENYTKTQRLLLKELTAYQMVVTKAFETSGGKAGENATASTRVVKRVKADVVETEFESIKAADGTTLALNTSTLLAEIREAACNYARILGYELGLCGGSASGVSGGSTPAFITLLDDYYPTFNYR
jgi:hypothetical protein